MSTVERTTQMYEGKAKKVFATTDESRGMQRMATYRNVQMSFWTDSNYRT